MKLSKTKKTVLAYICAIAMVVTSMTGYQITKVNADVDVNALDQLEYQPITVQTGEAEWTVADGTVPVAEMQYAFVESESTGDNWINWMKPNGDFGAANLVLWNSTNLAVKWSAVYPFSTVAINGKNILEDSGEAEVQVNTAKYFKKDTYNTMTVTNQTGDVVTYVIKVGNPTEKKIGEPVTEAERETNANGMYEFPGGVEWDTKTVKPWSIWADINNGYKVEYNQDNNGAFKVKFNTDTITGYNEWGIQAALRGITGVEAGKKYDYTITVDAANATVEPGNLEWKIDGLEELHEPYVLANGENKITGTIKATGNTIDVFFRLVSITAGTELTFKSVEVAEAGKTAEEIQAEKEAAAAKELINEASNLAKGKEAFAGSTGEGKPAAGILTDGSTGTGAWQANKDVENKTFGVNLGDEAQTITNVAVFWETAYATAYDIEVSEDGVNYTKAASVALETGLTNPVVVTTLEKAVEAKYVRVNATAYSDFARDWGISAFEIAVFAKNPVDIVESEPTTEEPTTEAPTTEPVTDEPTTEPVTDEPTTEPVTDEPTTEPVTDEPTTEPVTDEPTTEPVTTEPATEPMTTEPTSKPVQTTTAAPTTKKVKAPKKAKIKKINTKKKSAKKIKLTLKKISGAKGYQVAVYKTKANAKKNKKAIVKKVVRKYKNITITSKKLKNKKKLYVTARAYKLDGKSKKYGRWSTPKKVRIKK